MCRVAADDFAMLLPELNEPLANWSSRLQGALMVPYQVEEHRIQIPVFLGIAHGKANDAERLLSHAEAALAQANASSSTAPCSTPNSMPSSSVASSSRPSCRSPSSPAS